MNTARQRSPATVGGVHPHPNRGVQFERTNLNRAASGSHQYSHVPPHGGAGGAVVVVVVTHAVNPTLQ